MRRGREKKRCSHRNGSEGRKERERRREEGKEGESGAEKKNFTIEGRGKRGIWSIEEEETINQGNLKVRP